jgi:hypothetical protein
MPSKIYELRVFREGRQVNDTSPFLAAFDLSPAGADRTATLLERHLRGAVRRAKAGAAEEHLFHLEARDITDEGKGIGQVLFRWVLPAEEEEE